MNMASRCMLWTLVLGTVLLMVVTIDADDDSAGYKLLRLRRNTHQCDGVLKARILSVCRNFDKNQRKKRDAEHPELAETPFISERMAKVFSEIDSHSRTRRRVKGGLMEECCFETCSYHEIREKC